MTSSRKTRSRKRKASDEQTALLLSKAPFDASADRREALPASPTSYRAFETIQAPRHTKQDPRTEFQLAPGEYDEIERQLGRDEALSGYVKEKIRCVCS